jgi:hypothetical protein
VCLQYLEPPPHLSRIGECKHVFLITTVYAKPALIVFCDGAILEEDKVICTDILSVSEEVYVGPRAHGVVVLPEVDLEIFLLEAALYDCVLEDGGFLTLLELDLLLIALGGEQ